MADPATLRQILQVERDCLLRGALGKLSDLGQHKAAALSALTAGDMQSVPLLRVLLNEALANQVLLDAAHRGIRSALARIEAIRTAGKGLTAYDAQGRSVRHSQPTPEVERRA